MNADDTYCVNDYTFLEVLYLYDTDADGNEMTNRLSFSPNLAYSIVLDLKENGQINNSAFSIMANLTDSDDFTATMEIGDS